MARRSTVLGILDATDREGQTVITNSELDLIARDPAELLARWGLVPVPGTAVEPAREATSTTSTSDA